MESLWKYLTGAVNILEDMFEKPLIGLSRGILNERMNVMSCILLLPKKVNIYTCLLGRLQTLSICASTACLVTTSAKIVRNFRFVDNLNADQCCSINCILVSAACTPIIECCSFPWCWVSWLTVRKLKRHNFRRRFESSFFK